MVEIIDKLRNKERTHIDVEIAIGEKVLVQEIPLKLIKKSNMCVTDIILLAVMCNKQKLDSLSIDDCLG